MRRETLTPRLAWQARVEALGLDFHTTDDRPYWFEGACYGFSAVEIDVLEAATETLHRMCLEAVDRLVTDGQLGRVHIPAKYRDWVAASWRRQDPDLYGRFDLAFDGRTPPKLLEYNADTPTALLEAAVVQWYWLEQVKPGRDQFNSIHERLIAAWAELRERHPKISRLHFAGVLDVLEDLRTLEYMRDVCSQGGWPTEQLDIAKVGWNGEAFTDMAERPIEALFKLYPWEWMLEESFGEYLLTDGTAFIEPPWKMALSNKAILPVLWEMFPDHPNLLPAAFERAGVPGVCIEKPVHGREGADIRLLGAGEPGAGADRIYQAAYKMPVFDGMHPVIGSWVVAGKSAGIGIREDNSPITTNASRFVPHYFF